MEFNNFEEHIKDAFNKRSIEPSDSAWESVSGQLTEKPIHSKRPFYKIAVAAGLIGVFIGLLVYLNRETPVGDVENTIVNAPENGEMFEKGHTPITIEGTETEVAKNQSPNIRDTEKPNTEYNSKGTLDKTIAIMDSSDDRPQTITGVKNIEQQKLIALKISAAVAKVTEIERQSHPVTDREIDSLIVQAQGELLKNRLFMPDKSVDADVLLAEVEGELDEPFKDKLYKLLKKGIIEARTVIADREN